MEIELTPKLLTGKIVQLTDLGVKIELKGRMGVLHLPNRSLIADSKPRMGDQVEIHISYARVLKQEIM